MTNISHKIVGVGPTLVLVHGYAGSSRQWDFILPILQKKHKVVLLNLSGLYSGRQQICFDKQVEEFMQYLEENFLYGSMNEKLSFISMSYGCSLVKALTIQKPRWVQHSIFLNPVFLDPTNKFRNQIFKWTTRVPQFMWVVAPFLFRKISNKVIEQAQVVFSLNKFKLHPGRMNHRKLLFINHLLQRFFSIYQSSDWNYWRELWLRSEEKHELVIYDRRDPLIEESYYLDFIKTNKGHKVIKIDKGEHIFSDHTYDSIQSYMLEFLSGKDDQREAS